MHKLTQSVAKRKNDRLLSVDNRSTELCLDAIILCNEWIVERLLDEDCSQLTVRH
jgi:hypothetical protein